MNAMKRIVLAWLCVLMFPLAGISNAPDQQEAKKLLESAISRTNIFDLPSFRIKATLQIETQDKWLDGNYQFLWNGPDQWREEIDFPGYSEVQIGGKGTIWTMRNPDFIPLRIYQLHAALGFGSGIAGPVCINDTTGVIVRDSSSYSDSDFQPIGGKLFPRSLNFIEDGKKVAGVSITELVTPADFTPDSFATPPGASQQAGCMNPMVPRTVNKVPPVYPTNARQQHVQGTVAVDTEIGVDGVPKMKSVVANPDPSLAKSAADAIKAWRYESATCNGKPVPIETLLHITYKLSQ
jgi:TonB family protein